MGTDYSKCTDSEIWQKVSNDDISAFTYIYNAYADDLFRYGQKYAIPLDVIEDLMQETFIKIWELRKDIFIRKSIKYYIFSTFRREAGIKMNGRMNFNALADVKDIKYCVQSIQEILIENERLNYTQESIRRSMEKLTEREREALELRYLYDMSYKEISALMGVTVPALYNLVSIALKSIKEDLTMTDISKILVMLQFFINFF
ncbi:RNA polymerase sigma factor [Negadavirga shengliensis]|uniref:RNA polymerase sigma factor n=1 Tax=Negadavirga shengliensis TaxID=1389218 RepID=A0ABV9T2U9_9BACT